MTAEQLEASRAERLRLNGPGVLTFEDARTWLEETGLCLFLPRRQQGSALAPSFVEAVCGQRNTAPDARQIAAAEELLVRLEKEDVAVRLNLLGQPGEQPDFVVAAWVLPYVYALRGDRDWRRTPQLTGSRQVSPLAVQTYKLLEAGESTIPQLKHTLGKEVTEAAVLRAITELWQQLRIIPVIDAPGKTPRWQLLRCRFQKAIAEGASTSQVTAISVLASIYLQAVIAASMEDVELFLAPLTARSKVREVLRGLVATRQVHTMSLGHAQHFYVAGTLPEFTPAPSIYASAAMPASSYFLNGYGQDREDESLESRYAEPRHQEARYQEPRHLEPRHLSISTRTNGSADTTGPAAASGSSSANHVHKPSETAHAHRAPAPRKPVPARDRKPAQGSNGRTSRHSAGEARGPRWASNAGKRASRNGNGSGNGTSAGRAHGNGSGSSRSSRSVAGSAARGIKASANRGKLTTSNSGARPQTVTAGTKARSGKRYGFSAQRTKKRG